MSDKKIELENNLEKTNKTNDVQSLNPMPQSIDEHSIENKPPIDNAQLADNKDKAIVSMLDSQPESKASTKKSEANTMITKNTSPKAKKATKTKGMYNGFDLNDPKYYNNRDLNWLEFNEKILNEGIDKTKPLLEQLKFLAIFHGNLNEYYMVRVANILLQYMNNIPPAGADKISPIKQLTEIRRRTLSQTNIAYEHWKKYLQPKLEEKNIVIKKYSDLSSKQKKFVDDYYHNEIYPIITPQAIAGSHPMPMVSSLSLNFIVKLRDEENNECYARVKSPSNLPRFVFIPRFKESRDEYSFDIAVQSKDCDIMLLEDIISQHISSLFTGYKIQSMGLFALTRNTDVQMQEDEAHDLLQTVQDMIDQRRFGHVVRLTISNNMSRELQQFLIDKLDLKAFQVQKVKGPLVFSEIMALYSLDKPSLKYPVHRGHMPACFKEENISSIFREIRRKDIFLNMPYDTFLSVQAFIQQAAIDPQVIAIKQTLYRMGKNSRIIEALMEARRLGKQVTAVVELKARFDEEQNISWAVELERAGVHVVYGMPGLKIHSKLCLVVRKEGDIVNRYVHIGTGNYNPATAKNYTDLGLITAHPEICADVSDLFNVMTGYAKKSEYHHLLVSPATTRDTLFDLIDKEIEMHKKHGNGQIFVKCNQLADERSIRKLYQAGLEGVKVHANIRGVCALKPNIKGFSDNITVTSVVGRFLEHARIYAFNNNGNPKIFFGSADLMRRNLNRRIEVITPILDEDLKNHVYEKIVKPYMSKDTKAYYLQEDGSYLLNNNEKGVKIDIQEQMLKEAGK